MNSVNLPQTMLISSTLVLYCAWNAVAHHVNTETHSQHIRSADAQQLLVTFYGHPEGLLHEV